MKIKIFLLLFTVFTLALFPVDQEQTQPVETKSLKIDYTAGLNFSYNRTPVLMGDDDIENTLIHSYLALEVDVGVSDYFTAGVVAGYAVSQFDDPVDFFNLPLSLSVSSQSYKSMIFGARAKSDFLSWHYFTLRANGEILFFKSFEKESLIQLPIVTGTTAVKQSFSHLTLELLVQYDGFSTFTVFAGPQLYRLKGKITASERLEELEGEEEFEYKQKNTIGLTAGVNFELGSHFDLNVKVSLFSKTSLSIEAFYIF
ncbi:MAG: hypothetical protein PVH61_41145 [Candidatus Aminicenantes bacterium]|jgi:hypothetical protein